MLTWLVHNWLMLTLSVAAGAYFAFYVSAARLRRNEPDGRRRPEKDC